MFVVRKLAPLLISLSFLTSDLAGQIFDIHYKYRFERIGAPQGLPNEYVYCVTQDSLGFIWFGTKDGLVRYDGRRFKVYKSNDNDSNGLVGNEVILLFRDSKARLWVGTTDALHKFNFESDSFSRISAKLSDGKEVSFRYVSAIAEDDQGYLWIGTWGQGLYKYDPESGNAENIKIEPAPKARMGGLRNSIYHLIYSQPDTLLVAGSHHNLTILNTRNGKMSFHDFLPENIAVVQLFHDQRARTLVGPAAGNLYEMTSTQGGNISFTKLDKVHTPASYSHLLEDRDGNLWISTTRDGIFLVSESNSEPYRFKYNSQNPAGLSSNEVNMIYEDRNGNLWIATSRGVCKWSRWQKPFRLYTHNTEEPNSLSDSDVTGLDVDSKGHLWISTFNDGICEFNPTDQTFTRYNETNSALIDNWSMDILADQNGSLWIAGNWAAGLMRFWPDSDRFKGYRMDRNDPKSLASNVIITLYQDHENRIWLGPSHRGLQLYNPIEDTFEHFIHQENDSTSLSHNHVLSIYQDQIGTLWVGTEQGLNRFDEQQQNFVHFPETASMRILSLLEDSKNRLWIGSNRGLFRMDRKRGNCEHVPLSKKISDLGIYGIIEDNNGNLWLQTSSGAIRFNPVDGLVRIYDKGDGWVLGVNFEQEWLHSTTKLKSGELVFGGSQGIIIFDPEQIQDNPFIPPVQITGFNLSYQPISLQQNVNGDRAERDSILTRSIAFTNEITLKHNETTFSFEFAALDYTNPKANQYAFMLEGFNREWVPNDNQTRATFTNIPPGEYTFRVKGASSDGVWNEEGAAVRISILPPWWRTDLAYAGYVVIIGLVLFGIRQFELNRSRMQNELRMKAFEARKLQEVDRLKSRFFANISHEFRTPLTLILGPLEDVIAGIRDKAAKQNLQLMQRSANRLLRLINQLLDLSRLESGRMILQAQPGDLTAFVKGIVMSFASLAEQKKITLNFEPCEGSEPSQGSMDIYFDPDKIEQIFTNLLSNAFKFTPEGGKVTVAITMHDLSLSPSSKGDLKESPLEGGVRRRLTGDAIEISVKDTGCGIPADRLSHIFDRFYQVDASHSREHEGTGIGLALTKELVELHHGTIDVRSQEGVGTEFIIRLPVGKEHLGEDEIVEVKLTEGLEKTVEVVEKTLQMEPLSETKVGMKPSEGLHQNEATIILVVDDHPDVRAYIRNHLEADYTVIEANDGLMGLETAMEAIPDLVISDVMMPKLDGHQLCDKLKRNEKTSHIAVILLTAKAGEEDKLAGLETGADDYLTKPFNSKELRVRVLNLIEQRRKLRELFRKEGFLQPHDLTIPSVEEQFLRKLMEVIEANLGNEDFDSEYLSEQMHLGERQLQRKIRALTGQTPSEFIRTVRLKRARQMLEQQAGTVSEIAFSVGFNNLSYFSKIFKEEFGQSPSEIRIDKR